MLVGWDQVVRGVLVVLCVVVSEVAAQCGQPPISPASGQSCTSRIVGGKEATPFSWPWMAYLVYRGRFICGGSLVAPSWVLTAAHCVDYCSSPSQYRVVLGDHDRASTEDQTADLAIQNISAAEIISHSAFHVDGDMGRDVALIRLSIPAVYKDNVQPVCLPAQGNEVSVGTEVYVSGWGRVATEGDTSQVLKQINFPVLDNTVCGRMWGLGISSYSSPAITLPDGVIKSSADSSSTSSTLNSDTSSTSSTVPDFVMFGQPGKKDGPEKGVEVPGRGFGRPTEKQPLNGKSVDISDTKSGDDKTADPSSTLYPLIGSTTFLEPDRVFPENVICAGCTYTDDQGACNGDSGSAMVRKSGSTWTQVGITSFGSGIGCALDGFPSGFASVAGSRDWIDEQMASVNQGGCRTEE